jgi:phospholipase C
MRSSELRRISRSVAAVTTATTLLNLSPVVARADEDDRDRGAMTPIKHVVVIFQENVSFDHYFATYPHAANLPGESVFTAKHRVSRVNNLLNAGLLTPNNPNTVQPFRLSQAQQQGRCGYGPRLPLLVISPFARKNHVDRGLTDQSSILRFIEDNWGLAASAAAPSTPSPAPCSRCSTSMSAVTTTVSSSTRPRARSWPRAIPTENPRGCRNAAGRPLAVLLDLTYRSPERTQP